MSINAAQPSSCSCLSLADISVVPMGGDGLDERVFATLDLVKNHGGQQWWLYVSTCNVCGQSWMIAQEERIHDNYCLKRIDAETSKAIFESSRWPDDFLHFEKVLRLEREAGSVASFLDPMCPALVTTAEELRSDRPDISLEEIAYVLAISSKQAARLLKT